MATTVELRVIRSQQVSVRIGTQLFEFRIYQALSSMAFDLSIDDTIIFQGLRIVAGTPLIPYSYLESGNFFLILPDDELPDYNQFGITQTLIYFTQEEIEAVLDAV